MANDQKNMNPVFMLDRDQIFYSKAFRRLAGKAQVYVTGQDENLRNRLTHTLEVSQIARSIAQSLGLDLDLVEAIALGHDLGHTPFGHVGERTLHEIMTPSAVHILGRACPLQVEPSDFPEELHRFLGFKHNLQGLVVTVELEKNYEKRGLNLTEYTLYGIQAHSKPRYNPKRMKNHDMLGYYQDYLDRGCKLDGQWAWSLEALLVAQADEIAQWHHDIEDALLGGLITPKEVVKLVTPLLRHRQEPLAPEAQAVLDDPDHCDLDMFTYLFTRIVIDLLMTKMAETAAEHIRENGEVRAVEVPAHNRISYSKKAHVFAPDVDIQKASVQEIFSYGKETELSSFAGAVNEFPEQITAKILKSREIREADDRGGKIIAALFRYYYDNPTKLPDECVYAFFGAYNRLKSEAGLAHLCRPAFQEKSEEALRQQAKMDGMGSIRKRFADVFRDWAQTTRVEELLLMRTICNHIACMTDADAVKTYEELYG